MKLKNMFKKKQIEDTRTEYEKYTDAYVSIQVNKLNKLVAELEGESPETSRYAEINMLIGCIEEDIAMAVERQYERIQEQKVVNTKPKSKSNIDMTQLLVSGIGVAGTLLATSMVINNERDGNMMPQWSRALVDKSLRK